MSWKRSTAWTLAIISVMALVFIVFILPNGNDFTNNSSTLNQPSLYRQKIITGEVYLNNQPISKGTIVYYNPERKNEVIIDRIEDGRYEIDLSKLPNGWNKGDSGILDITMGKYSLRKTIVLNDMPIQAENIVLY